MLISVVIPAYNREKYIEKSVRSILSQDYKELEVIVVDDGSKDKTSEVVSKIDDERVKLITCEKNGGACKARNIGIENAKGEIIAFQDSDDVWHENKLTLSLKAMQESGADFVFTAVSRIGEKGYAENRIVPSYNLNNDVSNADKMKTLLHTNCVSTQTILAKKTVFDKIRFDERLPRFQDWDLALQVVRGGYKVHFLEEPTVDCYVLGDSITASGEKAVKAYKIIEEKYIDEYKKYPESYLKFCDRAAFVIERAGFNGAEFFSKAAKAAKGCNKKSGYLRFKYVLAKLRIYWPINKLMMKANSKSK